MFRALRHRHFLPFVGTTFAVGAFCRYQYQKPNKPLIMMMTNTQDYKPDIDQTVVNNNYDMQKFDLLMAELPKCKYNFDIYNIVTEIPESIELTKRDIIYILGCFKKRDSGWYPYMDNIYNFLEKRSSLTFEDKIEIVERVGLENYYGLSQIDLSLNRKVIKNYDEIRHKQKYVFNVVFIDSGTRYTIEEMNKLMQIYGLINNIQEGNNVDAHYNIRIKLLQRLK